tara:strand:- start:16218 stop:17255 length:1038 start_codon:yes stop_codon:yes gene_type:complete
MDAADLFQDMTHPSFRVYRSGASSRSDAVGYVNASKPIGINALDASEAVLRLLGGYASTGGEIFCDSGAFRNYVAGTELPYDDVLCVYRKLIGFTSRPDNLLVVAPDVVGDQASSFNMLAEYQAEMIEMMNLGVSIMVPFQSGSIPLSDYHRRVQLLLGRPFVVGLPSNAAAIPEYEVLTFLKSVQPAQVHFLGCKVTQLLHKAAFAAPGCKISSDSTRLRSHLGQGRALTIAHQEHAGELLLNSLQGRGEFAYHDETEMFGSLDDLIPMLGVGSLKRLADRIGISCSQLKSAAIENESWDRIDSVVGGYSSQLVSQWWVAEANAVTSPRGRSLAVEQLASEGVI